MNESQNSIRTAEFIAKDSSLAERVHIPKVYPEYSTKRVLTAEWIRGVRLTDRQGLVKLMAPDSNSSSTADLPSKSMTPLGRSRIPPSSDIDSDSGPLEGGTKWVMRTMIDLFCAQIFRWGWVHCDPHPGNIFIRPHPLHPHRPQLVLIDHGLYVKLTPEFRRQYSELWKALLAMDLSTLFRVAGQWGIGSPDLFASSVLLKPMSFGNNNKDKSGNVKGKEQQQPKQLSQFDASMQLKGKLKTFLVDTDKMPKELIFVGRNMRYDFSTLPRHARTQQLMVISCVL